MKTIITTAHVKARFGFVIPNWYTDHIHDQLIKVLSTSNKLQAVKFLRETSRDQPVESQQLFLKECKDICDYISENGLIDHNEKLAEMIGIWAINNQIPTTGLEVKNYILNFLEENNISLVMR